jgi:cell fate regulator YaaT (PSP1 superfamily)
MSDELDKVKETHSADACVNCASKCCAACDDRCKLQSYNWLGDIPGDYNDFDIVEVHFKNTRKGFYRNSANIPLSVGDIVAVEASPGHDIGRVSMVGKLVKLQMKRANLRPDVEILRVFRKAKQADLERFEEAKAKEIDTMIRSRKIAAELNLKMKIGDVEYQGDGNKAIFYYIADERVDFRQLIKVLADTFKIRIEMKQIGARQEAGRIGGIGPCGRPLCCASWMTNFVSVGTGAARFQDISLNPQKLAGQCAKLKCCINFEVDDYMDASKSLPPRDAVLETKDSQYYHFKTDIFKREITYSTDKSIPANLVVLTPERVFEVIRLNKSGEKPEKLLPDSKEKHAETKAFGDIIGQDNINRFDRKKKKRNHGRGRDNNGQPGEHADASQQQPRQDNASAPAGGDNAPRDNAPRNNAPRDNNRNNNRGNNGPRDNGPRDNAPRGNGQQRPQRNGYGNQRPRPQRFDRGQQQGNNGNKREPRANDSNRQENNNTNKPKTEE